MPGHGSARSVYSTASHLLSPRSLDSSSSASPSRPHSVSSSRLGTPQSHLNQQPSSLYPSSRHSNDAPLRLATSSRHGPPPQKRPRTDKGPRRGHPPSQRSNFPLTSSTRKRPENGESSVDYTSSDLSRLSRLSSSPSILAHDTRGESRSPYLQNMLSYHPRPAPLAATFPPQERLESRRPPSWTGFGSADDEQTTNNDLDMLNEVIMAIDVDKEGKVGCAYFVAMDEALVLEEDIPMGGIEAVSTLLLHVQPTSVIIPNRASCDLINLLERDAYRVNDGEESGGEQGGYILRHIVSAHFDYEAGKDALARVDFELSTPSSIEVVSLQEEPAQSIGSSLHHKLMRLAENINLDSCLSVGCAGAVLHDLDRRKAVEESLPEEEGSTAFHVRSIGMNTCIDTMLVSADSLTSLQILHSELHPNPQTRSSNSSEPKAKEAFSVTGLLQALASSAQGKRRLRQMLLRPSTDLCLIKERHKGIEILLHAENAEIVKNMRRLLRKLKNTKTLLLHVRRGVDRIRGQLSIRVGDWKALLRFAMVTAQLKQATHTLKETSGAVVFSRICNEIDVKRFLHIGDIIIRTIDFQLSKENCHTEILPGASDYLDGLRREFADVCHMLSELRESVVRDIPNAAAGHIRHCTIMPQLGFLIAVNLDPDTGTGIYYGQYHHEGEWTMCFTSEDAVYYKNQLMFDLDSQYGDLPSRIADEEIGVIMALAAAVLEHEEAILSASELFGELDSLLALALAAEKYNWTAPSMTTSNVIDIVAGRHPLQELLVPSYIPNDCALAGGSGNGQPYDDHLKTADDRTEPAPSMLILTGPNNSGKSVYMKQIALIVYLAHTGSYVPATRATIGVTDRILTRIATRETVVNDESAFLVDLKQAAFSMNFATRRSLLLIDEFGKGTTTESGSALFTAYLTYFLDLGMESPKVLAGTHFHEVFENRLLRPEGSVGFAHMDVHLDPDAEDPEGKITFLYRLLPGRGSSSLGVLCAATNGVPSDVIARAEALVALQDRNESLVEACSELSEEDKQGLEQAELVARRFLAWQVPSSGRGGRDDGSIREALGAVLAVEETGKP